MGDGAEPARKGYAPLRLHSLTPNGWSVISLANGAIVSDRDNRLLIRLTREEAEHIAAELAAAEEPGE